MKKLIYLMMVLICLGTALSWHETYICQSGISETYRETFVNLQNHVQCANVDNFTIFNTNNIINSTISLTCSSATCMCSGTWTCPTIGGLYYYNVYDSSDEIWDSGEIETNTTIEAQSYTIIANQATLDGKIESSNNTQLINVTSQLQSIMSSISTSNSTQLENLTSQLQSIINSITQSNSTQLNNLTYQIQNVIDTIGQSNSTQLLNITNQLNSINTNLLTSNNTQLLNLTSQINRINAGMNNTAVTAAAVWNYNITTIAADKNTAGGIIRLINTIVEWIERLI